MRVARRDALLALGVTDRRIGLSGGVAGARRRGGLDGHRTRRRLRAAHRRQVEGQRLGARERDCGMGLLAGDLVIPVCLLVVAKAPVPGLAKTRLAATVGDDVAADIAAAALLDTLDAVAATPACGPGGRADRRPRRRRRAAEIRSRLADFTVIQQRGDGFAARLANAHVDAAARLARPVLQIGMDTPQVDPRAARPMCTTLLDDRRACSAWRTTVDGGCSVSVTRRRPAACARADVRSGHRGADAGKRCSARV